MTEQFSLDDFMPKSIYVLDTETTGLDGAPKDLVVDIGITKVDLNAGTVEDVYSSVLGYEVDEWDDYYRKAWIFEKYMDIELVREAPPAMKVISDVRRILQKKTVTAYNIGYDMDKFLYREPWNMRGWFNPCTDIMLAAKDVCKLPGMYHHSDYRYPKLDFAYGKIVHGDPAGVAKGQNHRALSDAQMASYLMIQMYRDGDYRP